MRPRPRILLAIAFAAAALALGAWLWTRSRGSTSVVLATTTSTYDSGLLDRVLPWWSARSGVRVDVLSLGTGQALDVAGRGGADLVLVHAREKELAFVASGQGIHRVGVMYNDFVIVGPPADPARAREAESAAGAFRAIEASGRRGETLFVSRADQSGTHAKELAIWREAELSPGGERDPWYLEAGAGMGAVLRMAEERGAYVLTDRGTFAARRGAFPGLETLVEGGPSLRNPYAAILVNPRVHPERDTQTARRLVAFLVSPEGQALVGAVTAAGRPLFAPMARDLEESGRLGFPDQGQELAFYDEGAAFEGVAAEEAARPRPGQDPGDALAVLRAADPELARIVGLTLYVSLAGLALAAGPGLLLGTALGIRNFRGRGAVMAVVNTFMGLPPVLVGLVVYLALVGTGILYTASAMVLAQAILVLPLVLGVVASSVSISAVEVNERALSLGAHAFRRFLTHIVEARRGVAASLVLGFGAAISEVGAVVLVGGNIREKTQVLTGAILWQTELGNLGSALALGIVLLLLSLVVNAVLTHYQWKAPRR